MTSPLYPADQAAAGFACPVHRPGTALRIWLFAFLLAATGTFAADASLEYRVKAGFLFNFAKFIEWPPSALPAGAPLRIGLIAPPDVCATIEQSLAGKSAAGHPLVIERLAADRLSNPPHILFVQRSVDLSAPTVTSLVGKNPVLVIGETSGFAADGGTIGFVLRGDTLRFQVNPLAATRANLQVNSQLASLAEVIRPKS